MLKMIETVRGEEALDPNWEGPIQSNQGSDPGDICSGGNEWNMTHSTLECRTPQALLRMRAQACFSFSVTISNQGSDPGDLCSGGNEWNMTYSTLEYRTPQALLRMRAQAGFSFSVTIYNNPL